MNVLFPRTLSAVLAVVCTCAVMAGALGSSRAQDAGALACPPGSREVTVSDELRQFAGRDAAGRAEAERFARTNPNARICAAPPKLPEPVAEMYAAEAHRATIMTAPSGRVPNNVLARAVKQSVALEASARAVPGAAGRWSPYGKGPLIANDERFDEVNGTGFVNLAGRIDSLAHDPKSGRLFASIGTGGVWMSRDMGDSWKSIGDRLPTQVVGAVGWSKARGGTLVVASGEPLMGGNTYTGLGAFYSSNLGKTWRRAKGVPNGAMGFQVAVDQRKQKKVYVATSKGLFRSVNAGRTYRNVKLPTGPCKGKTDNGKCLLANFVTDVVVKAPDEFGNKGGAVLAAVGYRAGARPFPQDPETIESPNNGLYYAKAGRPGKFVKLEAPGFAPQNRIGRVELGPATGPAQDHDYVYAIVQDAVLFNGGAPTIDAPEDTTSPVPPNTNLNGIYVSADFGQTWTLMGNTETLSENPTSGSALNGVGTVLFNAPGIQAWYNEWITPDPTRQVNGIPTRLTFGLEEVWQNTATHEPLVGPTDFKVIGRYYAYETCIIGVGGVPTCPPDNPAGLTTTHPDQHDGIWISHGEGELSLVIGNDGGAYKQTVAEGTEELTQLGWGDGSNGGFHTLLPYGVAMAKDGTVWFGLQDNGSGKIEGDTQKQFMTYGADGFYAAVEPDNSDVAYTESQGGGIRVTTDGGQTWTDIGTGDGGHMFANPFVMSHTDPKHLLTGGFAVWERTQGPEGDWQSVFDLGTAPGGAARQMSAADLRGNTAYVGFCGVCDIISTTEPFLNGIATNVGGEWHFAEAKGLANRYITDVAIDPKSPKTVYVTLGGYANRQWRPPGSYGDANKRRAPGNNVYRSRDGGRTFKSISRGLPGAPVFTVLVKGNQLMVGTQIGAFLSSDKKGTRWAPLRRGLPRVPVNELQSAPQDGKLVVAATFGRGVYLYRFP